MIITLKSRRASIESDEPRAFFVAGRVLARTIGGLATFPDHHQSRAVVEVLRQGGGMMPRALLGGEFMPDRSSDLVVEVRIAADGLEGDRTCTSQLSSPLVPGLPEEFAEAALEALVGGLQTSGRLVVDRAAFDPVESSPFAFGLAAHLLAAVLSAKSKGSDVEVAAIAELEAWP
jgi:hypothetical protein